MKRNILKYLDSYCQLDDKNEWTEFSTVYDILIPRATTERAIIYFKLRKQKVPLCFTCKDSFCGTENKAMTWNTF